MHLRLRAKSRRRIVQLNSIPADKINVAASARWLLQGDGNVTYADHPPQSMHLAAGVWWPQSYDGELLVTFTQKEAAALGLKRGDTITVSVMGSSVTAKIANLRKVDRGSFSMNFVTIFSSNTFVGAPHMWLASLKTADCAGDDSDLMRAISRDFPSVAVISVRETLENARKLVDHGSLVIPAPARALCCWRRIFYRQQGAPA